MSVRVLFCRVWLRERLIGYLWAEGQIVPDYQPLLPQRDAKGQSVIRCEVLATSDAAVLHKKPMLGNDLRKKFSVAG